MNTRSASHTIQIFPRYFSTIVFYAIAFHGAPPFSTCGTLTQLAKFGDTPQQAMSVKTKKRYGFILVHQGFLSFFVLFTPKKKRSAVQQTSNFFDFGGGLKKKKKKKVSSQSNHQILRFLRSSPKRNEKRSFYITNSRYTGTQTFRFGKMFLLVR